MTCDELNEAWEACRTILKYLDRKAVSKYGRLAEQVQKLKEDILDEEPDSGEFVQDGSKSRRVAS